MGRVTRRTFLGYSAAVNLVDGDWPDNGNGAAGPSSAAGYPHITVPAGSVGQLPVGLSFMARAWEEPELLRFTFAFERPWRAHVHRGSWRTTREELSR